MPNRKRNSSLRDFDEADSFTDLQVEGPCPSDFAVTAIGYVVKFLPAHRSDFATLTSLAVVALLHTLLFIRWDRSLHQSIYQLKYRQSPTDSGAGIYVTRQHGCYRLLELKSISAILK